MTRAVFNKRKPTDQGKYFISLPSDALHYVHHERMSADKLLLYLLIIDHYNPLEGCAFPSVERLAVVYGKSPSTTSKHIDDLKAVGLIDFPKKGQYVPLVPLPADDFYKEFPQAWTNYKKSLNGSTTRREEARERMKQWRMENRYL